ncbi:hypothetical protein FQA39_LY12584 [Lamprigera yunnana]|nr:hypothetical protein FQA39_LY12584 [Lamprigera yunnana]
MDVDCNESCPIKSEVTLTETFCFCELFRYYDKDLNLEPVDSQESFKFKAEDNFAEHMDHNGNGMSNKTPENY